MPIDFRSGPKVERGVRDPGLAEHLAVPVLERDARAGVGAVADADGRLVLRQLLDLDDHRRRLGRPGRVELDRRAFEQAELQRAAPGSRAAASRCSRCRAEGREAADRGLVVAMRCLRSGSARGETAARARRVTDERRRLLDGIDARAASTASRRADSRRRAARRASRSWRRSRPAGGTARRRAATRSRAACRGDRARARRASACAARAARSSRSRRCARRRAARARRRARGAAGRRRRRSASP